MASGGEILGAAAGGAAIIPALIGKGKSNFVANPAPVQQSYFGPTGAADYSQWREQQAGAIDQRSAPTANYMQADFDRQRAAQARASQSTIMNQLMARAAGQTPSIAGMQAQQDLQRATAAQSSLAASARGPGALALAQQNAANQTANVHGQISNQAQINAANERMQAEQAAFGAASGMRGQDYGGQQLAAQQAQFQAGQQLASRNANDARAMGYAQMGHGALGAEQQGQVQTQAIQSQGVSSANQANAATSAQNAQSKGIIETVGDWFSDVRAKVPLGTFQSDFTSKTPLPGLLGGGGMSTSTYGGGGTDPMSGPAAASFDVLNGGGLDAMGSLQKHSDFATQFQSDPTGGMSGGSAFGGLTGGKTGYMLSDDRTKLAAAWDQGHAAAISDFQKVSRRSAADIAKEKAPVAEAVREARAGAIVDRATKDVPRGRPERTDAVARAASEGSRANAARVDAGPEYDPVAHRLAAEAEARRRMAAQQAPAPAQPLPVAQRIPVPDVRADIFTSDFTAKEVEPPGPGQAQYMPGRGWVQPGADESFAARLPNEDAERAVEQQQAYNDQDARVADLRRQDGNMEVLRDTKRRFDNEDAARQTRASIAAIEDEGDSGPRAEGKVPWWVRMKQGAQELNDAQFGGPNRYNPQAFGSDFTTKKVIDLDEDKPTAMRDGASDPRTRSFDQTFHRDTPADQKRVKRGVEDKAGKDADAMIASFKQRLGEGPAVASRLAPSSSPVADANRTMTGYPYQYKPEFTPQDQKPGEPNFGFMAQNLEKSPITATAVKEDPSGLKRVDAMKLLRVLGASVADLQRQEDETRLALVRGGRKAR